MLLDWVMNAFIIIMYFIGGGGRVPCAYIPQEGGGIHMLSSLAPSSQKVGSLLRASSGVIDP